LQRFFEAVRQRIITIEATAEQAAASSPWTSLTNNTLPKYQLSTDELVDSQVVDTGTAVVVGTDPGGTELLRVGGAGRFDTITIYENAISGNAFIEWGVDTNDALILRNSFRTNDFVQIFSPGRLHVEGLQNTNVWTRVVNSGTSSGARAEFILGNSSADDRGIMRLYSNAHGTHPNKLHIFTVGPYTLMLGSNSGAQLRLAETKFTSLVDLVVGTDPGGSELVRIGGQVRVANGSDYMVFDADNYIAGWAGVWVTQGTPSSANFMIASDGNTVKVNAAVGQTVHLSIGNTTLVEVHVTHVELYHASETILEWWENDEGADLKRWRIRAAGGELYGTTLTDAGTGTDFLRIQRQGASPGKVARIWWYPTSQAGLSHEFLVGTDTGYDAALMTVSGNGNSGGLAVYNNNIVLGNAGGATPPNEIQFKVGVTPVLHGRIVAQYSQNRMEYWTREDMNIILDESNTQTDALFLIRMHNTAGDWLFAWQEGSGVGWTDGSGTITVAIDDSKNVALWDTASLTDQFIPKYTTASGLVDSVVQEITSGIQVKSATISGTVSVLAWNSDNTAGNSHAKLQATTGGASGGDPFLALSISGVQDWVVGVDNNDGDALKIDAGSSPSTATPILELSTTGLATLRCSASGSTVDVINTATSGASAGAVVELYSDDGAAMASGDRLAYIGMGGAEDAASTLSLGVEMYALASEAWTGTNNGAVLVFRSFGNSGGGFAEVLRLGDGAKIGMFGVTPVAQSAAYTVTNGSTDRALDVTGDTLAQVAAVLGTLIADLQALGPIG
jgi:hypothetical protein